MFIVTLSCAGNPDHREPDDLGIPARNILVNTLEEASIMCRKYIDDNDLGGGNWTGGQVVDLNGNLVARISYNGRIWPIEEWEADEKKLIDAGLMEPHEGEG